MAQYLNIHDSLDARRQDALKNRKEGPRTFVVGPTGADPGRACGHVNAPCPLPLGYQPAWLLLHAPLPASTQLPTCAGCFFTPTSSTPWASFRYPCVLQTWASPRCARSCSTTRCGLGGRLPMPTWTLGRAASPCLAASPPRQVGLDAGVVCRHALGFRASSSAGCVQAQPGCCTAFWREGRLPNRAHLCAELVLRWPPSTDHPGCSGSACRH